MAMIVLSRESSYTGSESQMGRSVTQTREQRQEVVLMQLDRVCVNAVDETDTLG
jgi:hypothetical protein